MGQIGTAFRAFFAALFNAHQAEAVRRVLDGDALPKITAEAKRQPSAAVAKAPTTVAEPPPKRSDALTLLAALQREARLVDLMQEPLDAYTDEQIGAAARGVLKDSAAVVQRFFALKPVRGEDEGSAVEVPSGYDAARFRLTGRVEGSGPFRGKLAHRGWQATSVNVPSWTGSKDAALVIAPAEVEV
jgi:hypothetical protein